MGVGGDARRNGTAQHNTGAYRLSARMMLTCSDKQAYHVMDLPLVKITQVSCTQGIACRNRDKVTYQYIPLKSQCFQWQNLAPNRLCLILR